MAFELHPIGTVRSPYKVRSDAPRQGRLADTVATIVIDEQYRDGLYRLEESRHLFVLCWFDRSNRNVLRATPPHRKTELGIFATRSPDRPNPVSLSLVDLLSVKEGILTVRGLDALDGTPVIDIKPYAAEIDMICGE